MPRFLQLTVLSLGLLFSAFFVGTSFAAAPVGKKHLYKKVQGRDLALYVTKPEAWKPTDRRPAIVFFHGGAWISGAPGQFTEHSRYFASRGVVCIQVEYRLLNRESKDPPLICVEDARSAMRWIRSRAEQFGIDENRIASAGGSAGGHLAAFLGTVDEKIEKTDAPSVSSRSNAMILFNPVYDNGPGEWGSARVGDRFPELSPAHNLSADDPPAIVFFGSEDSLVSVSTAERFRDRSKEIGLQSELILYEGQPHGFFNHGRDNNKWYIQTVLAADRFLCGLGWLEGPPTLMSTDDKAKQPGEALQTSTEQTPNFIIVFCDDMGYADIGPFGAEGYETPHLDRMASEGMKFTDFYVGRSFCTPSRAALLTGCIPTRVGIGGNFGPKSKTGLSPDEMTIAEILKTKGYATACFGKWHLGHRPEFLPPSQGFDEYFGIPYSNDMWPFHPNVRHLPMEQRIQRWPHLPLYEGLEVINPKIMPEDQVDLTKRLFQRAVDFISTHREEPFFIYLPSPQPHVPLFASSEFQGSTERGLYGDVISEIDSGMGQIFAALKSNEVDSNTCVIFTSDNGPWLLYGDHAGKAKPLREGKGTNFEGGFRVPCLMRWPDRIPADQICREVAGTIDLLPTIAALTNARLPKKKLDGKVISELMEGKPDAKSPHDYFYHYDGRHRLIAVRSGRWKLLFPHAFSSPTPGTGGIPGSANRKEIELALFDLRDDVGETTNVIEQHPEIAARLQRAAEQMRQDLGDGEGDAPGRRPLGQPVTRVPTAAR